MSAKIWSQVRYSKTRCREHILLPAWRYCYSYFRSDVIVIVTSGLRTVTLQSQPPFFHPPPLPHPTHSFSSRPSPSTTPVLISNQEFSSPPIKESYRLSFPKKVERISSIFWFDISSLLVPAWLLSDEDPTQLLKSRSRRSVLLTARWGRNSLEVLKLLQAPCEFSIPLWWDGKGWEGWEGGLGGRGGAEREEMIWLSLGAMFKHIRFMRLTDI